MHRKMRIFDNKSDWKWKHSRWFPVNIEADVREVNDNATKNRFENTYLDFYCKQNRPRCVLDIHKNAEVQMRRVIPLNGYAGDKT